MIDFISELREIGIVPTERTHIRTKDGISIYSIMFGRTQAILKVIENRESLRELVNYHFLRQQDVPTLKLYGITKHCIIMEDLNSSPQFRLGRIEDMTNPIVMEALGKWYKELHACSVETLERPEIYKNFTVENIMELRIWTGIEETMFFNLLEKSMPLLLSEMEFLKTGLCYNDFYFENLAVSHDETHALMFDYNMMDYGFVEMDLVNALWFSDEESKCAFFKSYGTIKTGSLEYATFILKITTLVNAMKCNKKPQHIHDLITEIETGKALEKLKELVTLLKNHRK